MTDTTLSDVQAIYEADDNDPLSAAISMQRLINSGMCWRLEGAVGREAMAYMENGLCCLGPSRVTDYWGSTVPSRDDVKPGTKGSIDLVRECQGDEWAEAILRA